MGDVALEVPLSSLAFGWSGGSRAGRGDKLDVLFLMLWPRFAEKAPGGFRKLIPFDGLLQCVEVSLIEPYRNAVEPGLLATLSPNRDPPSSHEGLGAFASKKAAAQSSGL